MNKKSFRVFEFRDSYVLSFLMYISHMAVSGYVTRALMLLQYFLHYLDSHKSIF